MGRKSTVEQIYLWGAGQLANDILNALDATMPNYRSNPIFRIKGIIDNDVSKQHQRFHGLEIVLPGKALQNYFSNIVIVSDSEYLIREQAEGGYHIPKEKIQTRWYLLQLLLQLKYEHVQDEEIRSTLDYWRKHSISLFNNFMPRVNKYYEVMWDWKLNLPFIEFPTIEGKLKPMYYPRNYRFMIKDGVQVVEDILYEQMPMSPHLYTHEGHKVHEGDVILDGGVCEGNFALRYIDLASKLYLAECDPNWKEPLFYTFEPWQDKVIYCDKPLSNRDGYYSTKIDTLIRDKLDFMKLDIEGSEISAIEGAEKILKTNAVNCSICCYHKKEDETILKQKFSDLGYCTDVSKGYMTFMWDRDIWWNIGFRRGIVYAKK